MRTLPRRTFQAVAVTLVAALVVAVYAIVAVRQLVYEPNKVFHAFGDYLTLFGAMLGTSATATILALLRSWRVSGGNPGS